MQGFRRLQTNKWNRNVFSRIVVTDSLIDLVATFFVASCRSFYCEIFTTTTILRRLNKPKRLIPAKMQIIHKFSFQEYISIKLQELKTLHASV